MSLFNLCLVVSSKMGKTKAKHEPYKDFNQRDRFPISTWRTLNRNMKKSYDNRDVNSRKHNRSHKVTEGSEMVEFKIRNS